MKHFNFTKKKILFPYKVATFETKLGERVQYLQGEWPDVLFESPANMCW
jgi:hypothetical protein